MPGATARGGVVLRPALDPGAEIVQTVGPALEPGLRYTVTAWVRALAPGSVAVVGVRWEGGHPRVFRGIDPEDGWVKIEFRFDAPTQPGWRQVVLTGSGEMVWDDIGLFEADSLEQRLARGVGGTAFPGRADLHGPGGQRERDGSSAGHEPPDLG